MAKNKDKETLGEMTSEGNAGMSVVDKAIAKAAADGTVTPAEADAINKAEDEAARDKVKPYADPYGEARERNKDLDPFKPADRLKLHLPSSSTRLFVAVAEAFKIESRLGAGPCKVLKKFMLPCGDLVIADDTFDPVEERMTARKYASLLERKYITPGGEEVETKLLAAIVKK